MLQGATPGKQHAPNPPEEVLEDPFIAGELSSPGPDEPGLLGLPQHLPMALLLKKQE
jgi:hypothetical protein